VDDPVHVDVQVVELHSIRRRLHEVQGHLAKAKRTFCVRNPSESSTHERITRRFELTNWGFSMPTTHERNVMLHSLERCLMSGPAGRECGKAFKPW
jgi:hypothetical protein